MANEQLQVIDLTSETFDFSAGGFSISGFTDRLGKQWFSAQTVCENLDIRNVSQAVSKLPDAHKAIIILSDNGKPIRHLMVTEPGLYRLIFRSRKSTAEQYQDWVFDDILPEIRKNGGYISPSATPEQIAALEGKIKRLSQTIKGYEDSACLLGMGRWLENSVPRNDR